MYPGLIFESLPWWIAAPLLQIGLLVFGMALDETYVNRATVLTGALALYTHSLIAGGVWMPVGLYLDIGLVIGAYGLYAYVVDAYVGNWFRVAAYFVYSPLAIMLVILLPDIIFPVALVVAGFGNLQLMNYLEPVEPYYFGPETVEAYESAVVETGQAEPGDSSEEPTDTDESSFAEPAPDEYDSSGDRSGVEPTPAGGGRDERGILPEFMRRL
ncbi:hypothetical protein OB919_09455 [Halobacteria archaeon AArc-curdl1]|uniref:Uncharacterized protein n=1 Tax=Natronosalvus hydrolyticus TaxID=2979988 RepID=A0AAP2Z8H0_9EURY|nr:hypothetical protein [Halobacteria archaeon AArc-curdl1]